MDSTQQQRFHNHDRTIFEFQAKEYFVANVLRTVVLIEIDVLLFFFLNILC